MKPEHMYQELKELAEKMDITVLEQNLRKTGIHVNSGLCKIKGKKVFIMDKHESVREKTKILSMCLSQMEHEDIYVVPAVREILKKHGTSKISLKTEFDNE